ncbi:hypothetical protein FRC10_006529 [Ceratobasidium sp. 414]|nr:hypothetical protein FRC10_006529 [Ceratobasidium sp. 414]
MTSAQVDRLAMSIPSTSSDLMGHHTSTGHVASGSFSPTQDADLLREAALRSRRARKQASLAASSQNLGKTAQLANDMERPSVVEDVQMDDATAHTVAGGATELHSVDADTEDGEIFEDSQNKNGSGNGAIEAPGETALLLIRQNEDTSVHSDQFLGSAGPPCEPSSDISKFVRPSLNMTANDLDEAKRLILDLLGLGVTPEYLVDCGISSQCLAVCFYEMNLRFPLNLDRSKVNLPPFYDIDKHMQESRKKDRIVRQRTRDQTTQKPISSASSSNGSQSPASKGTALPALNQSTDARKQKRGSLPSPPISLPSKPVSQPPNKDELICDTEPIIVRTKANVRLPPSGPRALKERMETMIAEDQKRMELLARKAAMDSITRKRAAKFSPKPSPDGLERPIQSRGIDDVSSAVDALLAAVRMSSASVPSEREDNSGRDLYDGERSASIESGVDQTLPDYDSDAMVEHELDTRSTSISDMDDGIAPDPASILGNKRHPSPAPLSPLASEPILSPRAPPAIPSPRIRFEPLDGNMSSGSFTPPPVAVPIAARKSRPTASDFIDQAPPRPSSAFAGDLDRNAPLKRKCYFVDPQVWPKRLVIDLDSSDEEDDDEAQGGFRASAGVASTSTSRGSVERAMSNGGSSRPGTDRGRDVAAQMLLEKELQIKAMMQKIKIRELKKKMGSVSAGGTPVLAAASIVSVPEGVMALSPSSGVSPPSGPPDIAVIAMEATKQETGVGVVSTLDIQQGFTLANMSSPDVEAPGPSDNTLGSDLEISVLKPKKGKGKATEAEATAGDPKGVSRNERFVLLLTHYVDSVAISEDPTQPGDSLQSMEWNMTSTHFKPYRSPLAGFTGPNFQPPVPTDRQLPTIYWTSSAAGQGQDANRKLCQYEFPSGVCKDQACTDIHAGDLSASDDDIRRTVAPMFPNAGPQGFASIVTRPCPQSAALNMILTIPGIMPLSPHPIFYPITSILRPPLLLLGYPAPCTNFKRWKEAILLMAS